MDNAVYEIPVNETHVLYAYLLRQNPYTLCRLKALYKSELECHSAERIKNAEEILDCINIIEQSREVSKM